MKVEKLGLGNWMYEGDYHIWFPVYRFKADRAWISYAGAQYANDSVSLPLNWFIA